MTLTQVTKAGLDELALDHVFTIGASGSSAYTFQGEGLNGTVNNPTLYLTRGKTYRFENGSGGHPIRIQSTSGASGTAYNTGVTNNAGSGTVIVEVQHDAPDVLYYQCTSHSAMNGILYITGALADGGVTTAKIADDAVDADKLANSINTAIAANTAKNTNATHTGDVTGSGALTIANDAVTTVKILDNNVTDAKINSMAASKLTGALPAISGANLTNLPASGKATNLVINGAMEVAQRGTSSNSSGFQTVDRFGHYGSGWDEAMTQSQSDVASGTTPYTLGFRKAFKLQNGNQTGGAGTGDQLYISHKIEAQNIATSGWNYTSASSYITLSFWVKSSVAQNFYGYLKAPDGTAQNYPFETGSLPANAWTKITKTIPGNSNLQFDMDANTGVEVVIAQWFGTDKTGSVSLNAWGAWNTSIRLPDMDGTMDDWYETNNSTFELTGVQLEVGDSATDFQHRSFTDELLRCQRYFYKIRANATSYLPTTSSDGRSRLVWSFPVLMRANPSGSMSNYTLSTTKDGVTGYQSSSNVDVLYDGTFAAEL